jgi:hypothetical protein
LTSTLFVVCGLFVAGSGLAALLKVDPDRFGRGPNVIIKDDQERHAAFRSTFQAVLVAGLAVAAVGGLIPLRRRWPVYLGFPVTIVAALIWAAALFAANAHILWFVAAVGAAFLLCGSLVWTLGDLRHARTAAEFEELRAGGADEADPVARLVGLLGHVKSGIRLHAVGELTRLGPAAAPAVPALSRLLLKAAPPDPAQTGICFACGEALSMWTRDRVTSPEHPKGFPACMSCRNRLVRGEPGEAHHVAEALGAIGPAAAAAVPALRRAAGSYDLLLRPKCEAALERIEGAAGQT